MDEEEIYRRKMKILKRAQEIAAQLDAEDEKKAKAAKQKKREQTTQDKGQQAEKERQAEPVLG